MFCKVWLSFASSLWTGSLQGWVKNPWTVRLISDIQIESRNSPLVIEFLLYKWTVGHPEGNHPYWILDIASTMYSGQRHTKRSLMSWVIVIPWHRLFFRFFFFFFFFENFFLIYFFFWKSRCHTKRRTGAATRARPSFGMTTTQDNGNLFA